jgi:hypothetical protein
MNTGGRTMKIYTDFLTALLKKLRRLAAIIRARAFGGHLDKVQPD